jgi:hypothetical protein
MTISLSSARARISFQELFPNMAVHEAFLRLYPYQSFLAKEGKSSVEEVLNSFNIEPTHGELSTSINEIVPVSESVVTVSVNSGKNYFQEIIRISIEWS